MTRAHRVAGPYPYYGANGEQDRVADYLFDGTYLLVGEDGSVVNRDGSPVINWVSGKVWVNNHAHVVRPRDSGLNLWYLYFYLQTIDIRPYVTGSTQPKLNQKKLNRIPIPCPDRPHQDCLVALLDSYESTLGDLVALLSSELDARLQQYKHRRNKLLTFDEAV